MPLVGFGWFLCYGAGATKERYPTSVIGAVAVALGTAINFFFRDYVPWFVLIAAWGILGWTMNFAAKRLLHSLMKRNPAATERIKQKE